MTLCGKTVLSVASSHCSCNVEHFYEANLHLGCYNIIFMSHCIMLIIVNFCCRNITTLYAEKVHQNVVTFLGGKNLLFYSRKILVNFICFTEGQNVQSQHL